MMRWTLFAIALLLPATAMAKPAFPDWVPNGGDFTCQLCHVSISPPVTWNDFGEDVRATLSGDTPDWAAVCDLDSDGDDAVNGVELGDPDCTWVFGDSDPPSDVFDPSKADSTPPEPEPDPIPEDAGGSTDDEDASGGSGGGSGGVSGGDSGGGSDGSSGCSGGSTAPLVGLSMLLALALVTRRRFV